MLTPKSRAQIRFTGWRGKDYLRILCLAHIFIDTFPSGGGGVLVDAMALGIPVVSFHDDYMKLYDQTDWSPAEEIFDVPELIVSRANFDEMKRLVSRLIEEPEYRGQMARRCQAYMLDHKGDPSRAVRKSEDLYFEILTKKLTGSSSLDAQAAEVDKLVRRSATETLRTANQLKRMLRLAERVIDRAAEKG
jgi:glycosyltransferase involved in cell wall biosynthesis